MVLRDLEPHCRPMVDVWDEDRKWGTDVGVGRCFIITILIMFTVDVDIYREDFAPFQLC